MTGSNSPLGLFGGRFDPIHRGHVALAQAAADQLHLTEIRWLVTGTPVHKPAVASAHHRLNMVKVTLQALNDPRMVVDDREILTSMHGEPSFTATTIESFQKETPGRALVWLIGEDQIQEFVTWHRWEWLIQNMSLAIVPRPGASTSDVRQRLRSNGGQLYTVCTPPNSISSSQIRERIRHRESITDLVPKEVSNYIQNHHLYAAP